MDSNRKEILCLCRDHTTLYARRMLLEHFGYSVLAIRSLTQMNAVLRHTCPDMLLLDITDPAFNFEEIAKRAKSVCPRMLSVALTPEYGLRNSDSGAIDGFIRLDGPRDEWRIGLQSLFADQDGGSVDEDSGELKLT